jgi:hypothetical protein
MKKLSIFLALFLVGSAVAQVKTPQPSPRAEIKQTVGLTEVEVSYSRPSSKGRIVYGNLVPFGRVWRTGANLNTTVSFSDDVTIDGKSLKKGTYALFTIPKADSWDIIFYTNIENWGVPDPWDESKVALKTTAKTQILSRPIETFTIGINGLDNNYGHLEISWERTLVAVKFEVPTEKTAMASIQKVMAGPAAGDYFSAAQYYYQSGGDMKTALEYVNKAIGMNKEAPFWYTRQKSLIQAKLGDRNGAIETAKLSLAAAQKANNQDYVKMNQDSIAEWSKK